MKEKPLKLRNHLVIAAFGAHFGSHYSVDILAERHKHKIVVFSVVCALLEVAAQELSVCRCVQQCVINWEQLLS